MSALYVMGCISQELRYVPTYDKYLCLNINVESIEILKRGSSYSHQQMSLFLVPKAYLY